MHGLLIQLNGMIKMGTVVVITLKELQLMFVQTMLVLLLAQLKVGIDGAVSILMVTVGLT